MIYFKIAYFIGILIEILVRVPLQRARKKLNKAEQRITRIEIILLGLLWIFMFVLPLIYVFTDWLTFADYFLPPWLGWLGIILLIGALVIFIRAHVDLKSNWSPSLEIYDKHSLVTHGIYRYIRHPIYASQWLWVIAQPLLIHNWLAGPVDLIFFIFFYYLRVKAEEKLMLDTFGDQYREYMKHTGGVFLKI